MARGAAQARKKAPKPQTRKQAPARRPPSWEDQLTFTRLRRHTKWVYIALAVVFAGSFIFLGVGSGSTGIGDLLRGNLNLFGSGGSTTSSGVKNALKRTHAHPNDPAAWIALATAYQTDGKLDQANAAHEKYLTLRPKDADVLQQVAGYYENKASVKEAEAQQLQSEAPIDFGRIAGLSSSSQLGQVFSQDQIGQQATQKANAAYAEASTDLQKDESFYKRIVKVQPGDPTTQYHLGQIADFLGDSATALAAYKAVVKLAPTDPTATQARQRIALLTVSSGGKK
jgi:tetratricopeptide (TPR) repeat protein